ncbi:MAG: hypothetical protein JST62_05545 [Bacteroidetes bacterium]|nr:hypothetical protein [Bacteroidota bacterium]
MTTKKLTTFGTKKRTDLNDFEKSSIKDYKDRFAKWHNKQIDLLTFCINLNFTISIAIAGFIIANQDNTIFKDKIICANYSLTKTALCLLATTATIGVLALITRLNDFRLTKNTIKTRRRIFELDNDIKYEDIKASDKEKLKTQKDNSICWTTFLGKATWFLFYLQLILLLTTIWTIVTNA